MRYDFYESNWKRHKAQRRKEEREMAETYERPEGLGLQRNFRVERALRHYRSQEGKP